MTSFVNSSWLWSKVDYLSVSLVLNPIVILVISLVAYSPVHLFQKFLSLFLLSLYLWFNSRTMSLLKIFCHLFCPIIRRSDNVNEMDALLTVQMHFGPILDVKHLGINWQCICIFLTGITLPIPTAVHSLILLTRESFSRNRLFEISASGIIWSKLHVQPQL